MRRALLGLLREASEGVGARGSRNSVLYTSAPRSCALTRPGTREVLRRCLLA